MERKIINDANILIDLLKIEIFDVFMLLPYEMYITDFVLEELKVYSQKSTVENSSITIVTSSEDEIIDMVGLNSKCLQLSIEDCSVWYHAKKLGAGVITGDGKLRKQIRKDGIEVHGIIAVIDELVKYGLLSPSESAKKLCNLKQINPRLPIDEIDNRINLYSAD